MPWRAIFPSLLKTWMEERWLRGPCVAAFHRYRVQGTALAENVVTGFPSPQINVQLYHYSHHV